MKKHKNLKQKILSCVMAVSIPVTILVLMIMSWGSVRSTNHVLLDNMQVTARIASQNISSNLHLLTERIYNFSTEDVFVDSTAPLAEKQARFDVIKQEIEFVWLSAYNMSGTKLYGDASSPDSISDTKYFSLLSQTESIVIGEPYYDQNILQLCVGTPIQGENGINGYLIGSYKYDVLNDVLSQLVLGESGSACIVNETGDIIGDRDIQNIIDKKNLYTMYPSSANQANFQKVTSFQVGSKAMKLGARSYYTGYAPISGTNWALFVYAPKSEFMGTVYVSTTLSILLSLGMLLGGVGIIIPVSQSISKPLSAAAMRLQALAAGNLTEEVALSESNDETGILTGALSKTVQSLNHYIHDIETCLSTLAAGDYTIRIPDTFQGDFASIRKALKNITEALNHTMLQMSHSSAEVSDCARQLRNGSQEQSELIQEMERDMEEITASIERNRGNVRQIEQCAEQASQKTALGSAYMNNMLNAMSQIHAAVNEISKISQLIENISRQTNLLSLNASIEAARAGESGRGFAVVANEIGTLSKQTADALCQTSELIERSAQTIELGLDTAEQTAKTFQEIAALTKQYHNISGHLSETVQKQTDAVSYANNRLYSLKQIADRNDEMAADSLSQAEELQDYVAKVKIKQQPKR